MINPIYPFKDGNYTLSSEGLTTLSAPAALKLSPFHTTLFHVAHRYYLPTTYTHRGRFDRFIYLKLLFTRFAISDKVAT